MNRLYEKILASELGILIIMFYMFLLAFPFTLLLGGIINGNKIQIGIGGTLLALELIYSTTLDENGFKKSDIKKWTKVTR